MTTLRRIAVLVLAGALSAAACALPTDENPRNINDPAALEVVNPPSNSTTTTVVGTTRERQLFYFDERSDLLEPEVRLVPLDASIADVLNLLTEAPTSPSLRTAVPPDLTVASATLTDGTLRIVLADEALREVAGDELSRAVAQLVVTATSFEGAEIDAVRFFIGDEPQSVPAGPGGEDEPGPVDACDYSRFLPPGLSCTEVGS